MSLTTPSILAAYLYLKQAEQMPKFDYEVSKNASEEVIAALEQERCQREEAWFMAPEPEPFEVDITRLAKFIKQTEQLFAEIEALTLIPDEPAGPQYQTLFYDAAKEVFDHDKKLIRTYFLWLYLVINHKPSGPRWGDSVVISGVDTFVAHARGRFAALLA